jgi:hypothetical protein
MQLLNFHDEGDVVQFVKTAFERSTRKRFCNIGKKKGSTYRMWKTDGVLDFGNVRLLLEAKYDTDLQSPPTRNKVLTQALYYVKRISEQGDKAPNVICLADKTHTCLIPLEDVAPYLDSEIDWTKSPSSPQVINMDVDVYLHETSAIKDLDLKALSEACLGEGSKIRPSKYNLAEMYKYWRERIFSDKDIDSAKAIDIMYSAIMYSEADDNAIFPHPNKANTLVVQGEHVPASRTAFEGFFKTHARGLTPLEIDLLNSIKDRVLDEDKRRRQGAFFTPTIWAEDAHRTMENALGADWRDECIVWDCCAGTGNLTRDYDFADLIISTAQAEDVNTMRREGYNEGARIFQYDFLNPASPSPFFENTDALNVIPLSVQTLLKQGAKAGKRLVFLINPPYATSRNGVTTTTSKADVSSTIANEEMKGAKLGACSQQLYAQFLFQCEQVASEYGFKQKSVGVFCKPAFMVSGSFAKFRPYWYERYSYEAGFLFQASHFADVSGAWGVSFTLWNEGKTDIKQELPVTLKDMKDEGVISLRDKTLYASDGREASTWVREPVKGLKTFDAPQMRSGLSIGQEGRGKQTSASLFYFTNNANNIQQNQVVFFTSSCGSAANGLSVLAGEGWRRAIALYSARKLVKGDWVNDKDEYLAPQTDLEGYDQWVDDCHVYALLQSSNNTTAMRDITYKGRKYDIHNHFFWLTRAQAVALYGSHTDTRALYRDAKQRPIPFDPSLTEPPQWRKDGDPYFANILPSLNLSPLAQEILDDLQALFIKSFHLRGKTTHDAKGLELHLNAWDASIYQHKKLWATDAALTTEWSALKAKHKALAESLAEGVYTYGFLRK